MLSVQGPTRLILIKVNKHYNVIVIIMEHNKTNNTFIEKNLLLKNTRDEDNNDEGIIIINHFFWEDSMMNVMFYLSHQFPLPPPDPQILALGEYLRFSSGLGWLG